MVHVPSTCCYCIAVSAVGDWLIKGGILHMYMNIVHNYDVNLYIHVLCHTLNYHGCALFVMHVHGMIQWGWLTS